MAKVYSEFFDITIDGNMLTRHNEDTDMIVYIASTRGQVSAVKTGEDKFDISYPMNEDDHRTFSALIHRANSENKLKAKKQIDNFTKKPDNDPTPPSGGTPGASKQVNFTETLAIAA